MYNTKWSLKTFHISNTNLPAHTDPNQFFLSVFCNYDQYSIQENTDRAAHRIGAAQTTSVATAGKQDAAPMNFCLLNTSGTHSWQLRIKSMIPWHVT